MIDSHQQFRVRERGDYPWLSPELCVLYADYLSADIEPISEHLLLPFTSMINGPSSK